MLMDRSVVFLIERKHGGWLIYRGQSGKSAYAFFIVWLSVLGCDSIRPIESVRNTVPEGASRFTESASSEFEIKWMGPERLGESRFLRAPRLENLEVPHYPGANAIWGSTGRDSRGRIYFGVAAYGVDNPSAALWRLDPSTENIETLGLVNDQLDRLGVRRKIDRPETQMKIHSKIYQAADGKIYFSSQDEHDEAADGTRNALYGGRMFALDPDSNTWESIETTPEGLIALVARGRYVVAQGYFGHVLYQYDTQSKQMRKKTLGTYRGHASRNIFMDRRGHVFAIRAGLASEKQHEGVYQLEQDRVRVSLVELDTQFEEVSDWPLSDCAPTGNTDSHGITGFCEFSNGNIVFVTHSGAVWQISQVDGASELKRLGWMHPGGTAYCGGLFAPFGERFMCGFSNLKGGPFEWCVFDTKYNRSTILPLDPGSSKLLDQPGLLLYGSDTLDNESRAYVVGRKKRSQGNIPHVIRLSWE